jgi:hypothetical protein
LYWGGEHLLSMVPCVGAIAVAAMGPAVAGVTEAKALALRAHALVGEELRWHAATQFVLLSLSQSAAT